MRRHWLRLLNTCPKVPMTMAMMMSKCRQAKNGCNHFDISFLPNTIASCSEETNEHPK